MALIAACAGMFAQRGSLDPEFAKVPFGDWFEGGEQARMKWSASVSRPHLSVHQRLMVEVRITVDGAELARRRGNGELLMLMQFKDSEGRLYQDHGSMDLEKVEDAIRTEDVIYNQRAFVLPGDYRIA